MGDSQPKHLIYGIIAFTFVLLAGVAIMAEMNRQPGQGRVVDDTQLESFNTTFEKYEEIVKLGETIGSSTEGESGFGVWGVIEGITQKVWGTISVLWSSLDFAINTIYAVPTFGPLSIIPGWVPALVVTAIAVMIGFWLFSLVFGKD